MQFRKSRERRNFKFRGDTSPPSYWSGEILTFHQFLNKMAMQINFPLTAYQDIDAIRIIILEGGLFQDDAPRFEISLKKVGDLIYVPENLCKNALEKENLRLSLIKLILNSKALPDFSGYEIHN
ncbi:MAG: hypothetical protein AAF217_00815 [Pseudomonadota bacterium]